MRIVVLCSHLFAIPAIEVLVNQNALAGLATFPYSPDLVQRIQNISQLLGIPLRMLAMSDWKQSLCEWLQHLQPDAVFVLSFPYRIPGTILNIPRLGVFNFHPGHLPQYRGPMPIFWQIKNREPIGVLTVHRMDCGFDSGPVIFEEEIPFSPVDTYGLFMKKVYPAVAHAVQAVLEKFLQNGAELEGLPQDTAQAAYQSAPKVQDLLIDWTGQSAVEIDALVRACNPICGGAMALLSGVPIHIWQVSVGDRITAANRKPGEIVIAGTHEGIAVSTSDQRKLWLEVLGCDDGCFEGRKFVEIYGIKVGEAFQAIIPSD